MSNFLSSSCETRFQELEFYFCYGCHYTEPVATDTTNKKIRLCKNFAERLWGAAIDQTSTKFDNCGFKLSSGKVVIPSKHWSTGSAFFAEIIPPLYTGYTVEIVDSEENCFNKGQRYGIFIGLLALALVNS